MKVITTCKECGYLESAAYLEHLGGNYSILAIADCYKYDMYVYTQGDYCIPYICLNDPLLDIYKPRGIKWGTS